MLMLACCSSFRPHLTLSVLSLLIYFFHPLHRNRISSGYEREKKGYIFLYLFFFPLLFFGNVFLLLFTKIWTVVALSLFAMLTGICFYALRYGPSPYALPPTRYLIFKILLGTYMYVYIPLSFRLRLLTILLSVFFTLCFFL